MRTDYLTITKELLEGMPSNAHVSAEFMRKLFQNKCVICLTPTETVHEILPKSLDPANWDIWTNRVLLCLNCHSDVHRTGTAQNEDRLLDHWRLRLTEYYAYCSPKANNS